jgi:hypothetical protein
VLTPVSEEENRMLFPRALTTLAVAGLMLSAAVDFAVSWLGAAAPG